MTRPRTAISLLSLVIAVSIAGSLTSCQKTTGRQPSKSAVKGLTVDELKSSGKDRSFNIEDYLTNGKLIVTIVTDSNYERLKRRMGASIDPKFGRNHAVKPIPGLSKENILAFMASKDQTEKYENSMIATKQFIEWTHGSGGQQGFLINPSVKSERLIFSPKDDVNSDIWIGKYVSNADKLPAEFDKGSFENKIIFEMPGMKTAITGKIRLANGRIVETDILLINKIPGARGVAERAITKDKQIFATPELARVRFSQSGVVIFNAMKMNSDLSGDALQGILGGEMRRSTETAERTLFIQNRCYTEMDEEEATNQMKNGFDVISVRDITDSRSFGRSNSQILSTLVTGKNVSDLVTAASVPELKITAVWTEVNQKTSDMSPRLTSTEKPQSQASSPEHLNLILTSESDETIFDSGGRTGSVPAPQPGPQPTPQPQPVPQPQPIPDNGSPEPQPDPSIPDDGVPPIPPLVPDDGILDGDPLVLNLDGTSVIEAKKTDFGMTMFDIFGTGVRYKTTWISSGSGFLALDLNKNGEIDSVSEFFRAGVAIGSAVRSRSGFDHLATYDLDMNGRIDGKDPVFSKLLVWRDVNGDGVSQSNELLALGDVAKSISLTHEDISNQFRSLPGSPNSTVTDLGTFERLDGKMGAVQNLLLSSGLDLTRE